MSEWGVVTKRYELQSLVMEEAGGVKWRSEVVECLVVFARWAAAELGE